MVEDAESDGMGSRIEGEGGGTGGKSGAQDDGRGEGGDRCRYSVTA